MKSNEVNKSDLKHCFEDKYTTTGESSYNNLLVPLWVAVCFSSLISRNCRDSPYNKDSAISGMRIVQRLNARSQRRNELSENNIKHSSQPGGLAPDQYGPATITQAFFATSNSPQALFATWRNSSKSIWTFKYSSRIFRNLLVDSHQVHANQKLLFKNSSQPGGIE